MMKSLAATNNILAEQMIARVRNQFVFFPVGLRIAQAGVGNLEEVMSLTSRYF